jgi:predicted component of viral defense system (DUF524 family)
VNGTDTASGLAAILEAIAHDPHQILQKHEEWVPRSRVRRLEPVGLLAAIRAPNNLDSELRLPKSVPDLRVEHTVDVYENQLARSYYEQVAARLRRLAAALSARAMLAPLIEGEQLLHRLNRARRTAYFLNDVGGLHQLPTKATMVLLKRPEYRSLLESYLRFRRSTYVHLDDPALEAPLENLPHLYELWGTLQVIQTLTDVAAEAGYLIRKQRLARQLDGGLYLNVLPDSELALELHNPASGQTVSLTPQRGYSTRLRGHLRSISFTQIPDVTVEVRTPGRPPRLYLFDPKYKLQSEEGAEPSDGKPKKIDIDTMHAYRDAIRTGNEERAVKYAAILYPGPETRFGDGIEALPAQPLQPRALQSRLREVLAAALEAD